MKINASITDFPLYTSVEKFFSEFKNAEVDGVEIVGGYKNRWTFDRLFDLSKKYNLPITSFHQPIWSGMGFYFDEYFYKVLAHKGIQYVTFHPLAFCAFDSEKMKRYLEKVATLQAKYKIHMFLENMSRDFAYTKLFTNTPKSIQQHIQMIYEIGEQYGFSFTYDISHAELSEPHKNSLFQKMFPSIGVIHLSSFGKGNHHLPLNEGNLQVETFLTYLINRKFRGEVVLEVNNSLFKRVILPYDFQAIADSVRIFRKITDKLS